MSESIDSKAARYLVENRVAVVEVIDQVGIFQVVGSDAKPYVVRHGGEWTCTCPSRVLECSHILACRKITKFDPLRQMLFTGDDELSQMMHDLLGKA